MFTPLLRVFEVFAISLTTLSEGDTILLYCTRMMVRYAVTPLINSREYCMLYQQCHFNKGDRNTYLYHKFISSK